MTDKLIFKIVAPDEWAAAERERVYYGSTHDKNDGFLHFSTASQLSETLRIHYANSTAVVIVAINTSNLGGDLKYEYSSSRNENFPHLYGPLHLIYDPPEQATVISTLHTHVWPASGGTYLPKWLDELRTEYEL